MGFDIFKEGNDIAVILVHGFTGSPQEMEYVGEEMNRKKGWSVYIPCLPGHCTTPYDLEKVTKEMWVHRIESLYRELLGKYRKVFIAGLSMGGLITLKVAMKYRSIPAISVMAVPMKLKDKKSDYLLKALAIADIKPPIHYRKKGRDIKSPPPGIEFNDYRWMPMGAVVELYKLILDVRMSLNFVVPPILIFHSRADNTAHPDSARIIYERVGSRVKELVWFEDSYHVLTLDVDRECLTNKLIDFFDRFV